MVQLAILLGMYIVILPGYEFELFCRTDTIQEVQPNGIGYFSFTLINTGTDPDVYELNCLVTQTVPDWSIIYCLRGRCLEPGIPMYDTLQPGEMDTTIEIKVYTSFTPGEAVAILTVKSLSDTTVYKSISTHTKVSGGIEERQIGINYLSERYPSLLNRPSSLRLKGDTAFLFDLLGREVVKLKKGGNEFSFLNPGVYFILGNKERYKLLIFK